MVSSKLVTWCRASSPALSASPSATALSSSTCSLMWPLTEGTLSSDLVAAGRDTECRALSNAVRWHCEGRVILQGNRTVVLR